MVQKPSIEDTGETASQHPESDQHHERVRVVERFGFDHPREEVANQSPGFRDRPAKDVDLETLEQMLSPMGEDDHHEQTQGHLVLGPIEALDQGRIGPIGAGMGYAHTSSIEVRHKTPQS